MSRHRASSQFNYGGTGRGKTQATKEWRESVVNKDMVGIRGLLGWTAPIGWNQYLTTGNFIGCRPIIMPGAVVNAHIFESINFQMV